MKLDRFDSISLAERGVELPLLDPITREDSGAALILYGADSSICKSIEKEIVARNKARARAASPDEITEDAIEKVARLTKGWRGLEENGEELRFSVEKAKEIYRKYPELFDRAATFIFTRANFFQKPSGA